MKYWLRIQTEIDDGSSRLTQSNWRRNETVFIIDRQRYHGILDSNGKLVEPARTKRALSIHAILNEFGSNVIVRDSTKVRMS